MTAETVDTLVDHQEKIHKTVNGLGNCLFELHKQLMQQQELVARDVDSTNHRFNEVAKKVNSLQMYVD